LLQIWMLPAKAGLAPGYEQKSVGHAIEGQLGLVGSPDGRDGSVTIHQDVELYATRLQSGQEVQLPLRPGRVQWVQLARGAATLNGTALSAGDGAAIAEESRLALKADEPTEALVFDMAA
jgi:redox-sensitive bicupin YhaK (pirin superfamily)